MNFSLSEDQLAIRDLAAQIFTDRATDDLLLALSRGDKDYDEELWSILAAQGFTGLACRRAAAQRPGLPGAVPGAGAAGPARGAGAAVRQHRAGRHALAAFGTEAQQKQWLAPLAAGAVKLSAALANWACGGDRRHVRAVRDGAQWVLTGHVSCVADGMVADAILVPAMDAKGNRSVFIVDTSLPGVRRTAQEIGLLGDWNADLVLDGVRVGADALLGSRGRAAVSSSG